MNYSKILKQLREKNKLTQENVATSIGIKRSLYNQYEHQYDIIPTIRLNDLANFFNVSIDYLLNLSPNKKYENSKNEVNIQKSKLRLKEIRKENKLTQSKFASIFNTANTTISGYELGTRIIATPFLYAICSKYNISADYLLGKIDNPKYIKKTE